MIYLQRYGVPARLGREEQAIYSHCVIEQLPVRYFEAGGLTESMVTSASMIVGSVESYTYALNLLGVDAGRPNYYPNELTKFLGREIKLALLAQLREDVNSVPVFAKPAHQYKLFDGQVFTHENVAELDWLHEDTLVWMSDVVQFRSEFRVYVLNGKILGCCQYTGEVDDMPDMKMVLEAVSIMSSQDDVSGFALDVGNDNLGRTWLVEYTDGFALGVYKGLTPSDYYCLLQARWNDFAIQAHSVTS